MGKKSYVWRYRKVLVEDGAEITTPPGSRCLQIRPVSKKDASYVEWLEPVLDGDD